MVRRNEKKKRAARKRGSRARGGGYGRPSRRPGAVLARSSRMGGRYLGYISVANDRAQWGDVEFLKPIGDADYTVCQVLAGLSLATHTGLTGGTSHLFPVNTGGFSCVFNFSLNDLPQVASFQALFDQYRFERVELRFIPMVTQLTTTNTSTNIVDPSQFVLDFDDGSALASENAAMEYNTCQTAQVYEEVHVDMCPAIAPAYFTSGAFSGYGVQPSNGVWLDAASSSILHYGVKGWIGALAATSTLVAGWTVYARYTVSFKHTR